uniref:C3H1-type domain-containing protein n=1 Tax=viral metagenome TaxID=1070528 RepID=A0A6C0C9M1_9ZZZZ
MNKQTSQSKKIAPGPLDCPIDLQRVRAALLTRKHELEKELEDAGISIKTPDNGTKPPKTPICKFHNLEGGCTRKGCTFGHPAKDDKKTKNTICKFHLKGGCTKEECPFEHPKRGICNYNSKEGGCTKKGCSFEHPKRIICNYDSKEGGCTKKGCPFEHPKRTATVLQSENAFMDILKKFKDDLGALSLTESDPLEIQKSCLREIESFEKVMLTFATK